MYQRKVFNRYLTEVEERKLFRAVGQYGSALARRDLAWMKLIRQTGLRVTPLSRLTVKDAVEALASGKLRIRAETNKGRRGQEITVTRKLAPTLRQLLKVRRDMGYAEIPEEPLIMSRNHKPLSPRSFQARLRYWSRQAGLTAAVSPHWLRHTFAKRIIRRSTSTNPMPIVQHALGHADINSTAVYAWPDREELEAAIEAAQ